MIVVYDRELNAIGELDKVISAPVTRKANELWTASFTLALDDPKQYLCSHFNYVEIYGESGFNYGKYRIMPSKTKRSKSEETVTYECEHVLSTLLDDVIDGYLEAKINWTTRENIQRILDFQTVENWVLGDVDFERYFQYSFEDENGLLAPLLSIPKPFNQPYLFTFDTTVYPWILNLEKVSDVPVGEIRWGKDMIDFNEVSDVSDIVNYLIPKGAGDGVNRLTIEEVNGGERFLKDQYSINNYGFKKYIWIDKRFDNAQSLKESAQSLLDQWKEPKISFSCNAADLSIKEEYAHEKRELYGMINIFVDDINHQARIIEERRTDVIGAEEEVQYEINNQLDDIATTQADIERKIQVNEAYSQGVTNILNSDRVENADPEHPIKFKVWIPQEAENINYMELTWETDYFRGYTKGAEAGGFFQKASEIESKSTEDGGAFIESKSTEDGGGSIETTDPETDWGNWSGDVLPYITGQAIPDGSSHVHGVSILKDDFIHSHKVNLTPHSHMFNINIPKHNHIFEVTIPGFEIPSHTHKQIYGIYEDDVLPSSLEIKVDGNVVGESSLEKENFDITDYISKNANGKIQRGRFATIEIRPTDALAQITANLTWGVFIKTRKGEVL
ncbi:phage tail spike protein [Paraliobacillus ryukyuensis]|uniref:phage tail spike protein n=1 Tax=Paraliobacillus ryukyuensis TaxID=200904 RepID=UPI0009A62D39|nr:phage tail spike protein [Paraliobacillus ryukyuensis]